VLKFKIDNNLLIFAASIAFTTHTLHDITFLFRKRLKSKETSRCPEKAFRSPIQASRYFEVTRSGCKPGKASTASADMATDTQQWERMDSHLYHGEAR
jgi:hypothetical protein